ncbi:Asp23/Gls24 family envelope stress response protein [Streptomyces sp. TP-A0356]|uniref:Asp23/Gls24 family envelope stress response protein n=1 Tax=Streptomyces sp. TP-A0356 TaxID=1359208 RepID=UPI0006E34ADC|nr:Asp23/Gls24 family envelope stress response protein [Streptomyces sp. TP-A0356]
MAGPTSEREQRGELRPNPVVVAPGERGATRIADRVVGKIAAQAAREALGPLPPDAVPPYATVVVLQAPGSARAGGTPTGTACVRVSVELGYPCDIGGQCRAVRRRVAERVGALTGMDVPEVAVQVERLHPVPAHGRAQ